MKYKNPVIEGVFQNRPNRFIAEVTIGGECHRVHVKNTGRCRELLVPGCRVWLEDFGEAPGARKTRYDLIAVEKHIGEGKTLLINMDSQAPNKVAEEALREGVLSLDVPGTMSLLRREVTFGSSRFDLYGEYDNGAETSRVLIEVKGCTLENDGVVSFPDAPTQRGVKHIRELMEAAKQGYRAVVLIVVQMEEAHEFRPNDETHPEFGTALREAEKAGVQVLAYSCNVEPDCLTLKNKISIKL